MQISSFNKNISKGLVNYFKASSNRSGFKSVFLDRYDAHFTAAQHNYMIYNVTRLSQNITPDAVPTSLDTGYKFINESRSTSNLETTKVEYFSTPRLPTSRPAVWRIFHGLRFGWGTYFNDSLVRPFKNRPTGFRLYGRSNYNVSANLRYSGSIRALYWMFYAKRFSEYQSNSRKPSTDVLAEAGVLYGNKASGAFFNTTGGYLRISNPAHKKYVFLTAVAGVNHLRTVWYKTNHYLMSTFRQEPHVMGLTSASNTGSHYLGSQHTNFKRMMRLYMNTNRASVTRVFGDIFQRTVDYETYAYFRNRRHMRHHNYRIIVGRYERKLWNFDKTRQYWRYMRWVAHFFFRGLAYLRLFTMRIDVFLVNHLRIRNIALSRLLVRGGHAFLGERACRNPAQYVVRYDIVSISREVCRWLKFVNSGRTSSKTQPTSARSIYSLTFSRQATHGGMIHGPERTFAMPYGEYVDVVNAPETRSSNNWGSFSYFQGQRVVASAWW